MKSKIDYLIAKADTQNGKWLPLWVHSLDTYNVMEYLVTHWMTTGSLYALTCRLTADEINKTARFLSVLHDFGKASITFQAKVTEGNNELKEKLKKNGLVVPGLNDPDLRQYEEMPHNVAGEIMLLLRKCPASIAAIVGAHHGRPWAKGEEVAEDIEEEYETDQELLHSFRYGLRIWGNKSQRESWRDMQEFFYNWALKVAGIDVLSELPVLKDTEAVLMSGLLIMADWLASNTEYFPLIPYGSDSPTDLDMRAAAAIQKIKLPPLWSPSQAVDFHKLSYERFGFFPNEVQIEAMKAVAESSNPGLMILEAPMGIGKTEAALLAAEVYSEERVSGLLFALPTQATANGIFSRILEWGQKQAATNRLSVRLAHGMANLNEEYIALFDEGRHDECTVDDYENSRLVVHDFFKGRKQALLADFVIGTIDQVLLASLKQKHVMLRHFGLAGKAVIIDECHAFDAYMSEYLERTLEWLGKYKTPVIMLSATLPYERRAALISAYLGHSVKNVDESWKKAMSYPLLTFTDGDTVHQSEIQHSGKEKEVIIEREDFDDSLVNQIEGISKLLENSLIAGGCAAVIVNTVERAQKISKGLKDIFPGRRVLLLHSRFISEDRLEYENELLKLAGKKSGKAERDGLIVVGTQVIEQSLDFDVDIMISDLCPMDLLLQRIGRIHRHEVHDRMRPKALKKPKCCVLGACGKMDKGSIAVYGEYLLMRTKAFLPKKVNIPGSIAPLVQMVYDDNYSMSEEPFGYAEAKEQELYKKATFRKNADAFRINAPGKYGTINRLLENVITDDEHAKAQVRNGADSLETLVLFIDGHRLTRAPWRYNDRLSTEICPDEELCRAISAQRLRLPIWMNTAEMNEEFRIPEAWAQSVWLRNQNLIVFDANGEARTENILMRYSKEWGLIVERRKG